MSSVGELDAMARSGNIPAPMPASAINQGAIELPALDEEPVRVRTSAGPVAAGYASCLLWIAAAAVTWRLPDARPLYTTAHLATLTAAVAAAIGAWLVAAHLRPAAARRLYAVAPWLVVLGSAALVWQLVTAKFALLPMPFFPPPQTILDAYENDGPLLLLSAAYSLRLLALGFTLGLIVGFFTGVAMGWWPRANYWLHPIVRTIGPIPATAWLPLAFVVLPTSFTASIFILALATWFPVTFLTWSGVRAVNRSYYDVARTLGASQWFLIWKVAVPAALPSIFVGIFMGLGTSFVTLLAAEMLGVKAGLGWYVTWAQGWAAYPKVYAALAIMALLFSGLISVLFKVRNRALAWERGSIR
ncbi:MAG: ABC transporter permease subunit [Candidatus Velthaea sp.]|jgi:NitT/TauT family transport system permease protein